MTPPPFITLGDAAERVTPVRLRLLRRKGFDLQGWSRETNGLPAINVSRPSKFGNPHRWQEWKEDMPRDVFWTISEGKGWCCERAAQAFYEDIRDRRIKLPLQDLRGKNLACWCAGPRFTCHADYLLALANSAERVGR